jgi:hypothetical protein
MFESDERFTAAGELDAVELEMQAPPPVPSAAPAASPDPAPPEPPTLVTPALIKTEVPRDPAVPLPEASRPMDARPAPQTRAAEATRPAEARERAVPVAAAPKETVRQVEIHRNESTRTNVQVIENRQPPGEPAEALSTTPAPQIVPVQQSSRDEPSRVVAEPPAIVVAEPISGAALPDRPAPAPEMPPLVIEIGRIDIRIESETAPHPPAAKRRDPAPAISLDDFLARRGGGP